MLGTALPFLLIIGIVVIVIGVNAAFWVPFGIINSKIDNEQVNQSTCTIYVEFYGKYSNCYVNYYLSEWIQGSTPYVCDKSMIANNNKQVPCYIIGPAPPGTYYAYLTEHRAKCAQYDWYTECSSLWWLGTFGCIVSIVTIILIVIYAIIQMCGINTNSGIGESMPLVNRV